MSQLPLRVRSHRGNLTVFFQKPTTVPTPRPAKKRPRLPLQEVHKQWHLKRGARGRSGQRAPWGGWRACRAGRAPPRRWPLRAPSLRHRPACSEQSLPDYGTHFLLLSPSSVSCDMELLLDTYGTNDALMTRNASYDDSCGHDAYGSNDALFAPPPPLPHRADVAGCSGDNPVP